MAKTSKTKTSRTSKALNIGILAYDGCLASELFGFRDLIAIGDHIAAQRKAPRLSVRLVTVGGRRAKTSGGERLSGLDGTNLGLDLIVVPGFFLGDPRYVATQMQAIGPEAALLRKMTAGGTKVASICVGAFVLGAAGLLDGRRATTAWLFAEELARSYPAAVIDRTALVISDGPVMTTGAFAAVHDLAVGVIAEHCGSEVARATRSVTLVDAARSSQTPYIDSRLMPPPTPGFSGRVEAWLRQHISAPYDLNTLAGAMAVSSRTLLRRFKAERGNSPLSLLQTLRIDKAKVLLEESPQAIESIALAVGYSDISTFRRLFQKLTGSPPGAYRRRFGQPRGIEKLSGLRRTGRAIAQRSR
jgi:transcriptional regulator GlxA family with amidase domain